MDDRRMQDNAPVPRRATLSVAVVCRDNARTIARTLESARRLVDATGGNGGSAGPGGGGAGEVVAVDSGSTDGTLELLAGHGARVIHSEWLGHVRTKQLALDACASDWVLCLDSDESPDEALERSILAAVARNDVAVAGYRLNRKVFYRGRALNHVWQPEPRLRLVRPACCRWGGIDPHDAMELTGRCTAGGWIGSLEGTLRHDSFETFSEHFRKQWDHSRTMARSLHAAGSRGSYAALLVSPIAALLKQLILKRAFLDGYPGWLAAASSAAGALMKHAMLIEMSRSPER
ncbi:MAG: glycosyltransferase family 2 protein [Phycisphaeraceae bacterium]|nr:glycosyltransferase family 2 protein [Phycisphaeraceae bacterium]